METEIDTYKYLHALALFTRDISDYGFTIFGSMVRYIAYCKYHNLIYYSPDSCKIYLKNNISPKDVDVFVPNIGIGGNESSSYNDINYTGSLIHRSGYFTHMTGRYYYNDTTRKYIFRNALYDIDISVDYCMGPNKMFFKNTRDSNNTITLFKLWSKWKRTTNAKLKDFDCSNLLYSKKEFCFFDDEVYISPQEEEMYLIFIKTKKNPQREKMLIDNIVNKIVNLTIDRSRLDNIDKNESTDGDKLEERIEKFEKMGYTVRDPYPEIRMLLNDRIIDDLTDIVLLYI